MSTHPNSTNHSERKIDATLRLFAQVQPPANLEQRVHARLQRESEHLRQRPTARFGSFFFEQRIVFASAAAALASCAIVIGSVQHSRQHHPLPATGIHLSAPGSGLGAASGARIAPQPVPAPENTRSRSERKVTAGRATVSRDSHKPKGVAVPESPASAKP